MSDDSNVIDFSSKKKVENKVELKEQTFEFHFFPAEDGAEGEVTKVSGFLKFGPQFIAVTQGPDDASPVVFACQASILKYVKRLDEDSAVEATLVL